MLGPVAVALSVVVATGVGAPPAAGAAARAFGINVVIPGQATQGTPTLKMVPDAHARIGAPSGAKMSSPWCQPPETSPLGAPKVSPKPDGP